MPAVGTTLWIASGVLAGLLARIVPFRRGGFPIEFLVSVIAAIAGGLGATALDFGGWREPDWRAGVFAFFVALAALGAMRAMRRTA